MRVLPWTRKGRIAVDGSPVFAFDNALIAASGVWNLNLQEDTVYAGAINTYLPLDFIEVINDSARDMRLTLNDTLEYRVSANSTRSIQRRSFRQAKLTNLDAVNTIAAALVHVTMERLPADADSEARRHAAERAR